MRRPMCVLGVSLAAGTWAAWSFSAQEALLLSAAVLVTGLLLLALRRKALRAAAVACVAVAASFALHALRDARDIQPFVAAAGQEVVAEGFITEAARGRATTYYTLDAAFPGRPDLAGATLRIRSYGDLEFRAGEAMRCTVRLSLRDGPDARRRNPDELLEGLLLDTPARLEGGYALRRQLFRLRAYTRENLYRCLPEETADLLATMVLGQRGAGGDAYAAVNRAGTVHLLAVSGLHLSILTALFAALLARLRLPRRAGILLTITTAGAFALLVGASASIVRAFTMTATTLAAGLSRRRADPLSSLGFAVGLVCLIWPHWTLGRGLWLSAASTLGILLYAGRLSYGLYCRLRSRHRRYNRLVQAVCNALGVSAAAYGFTLPLQIAFYGWAPLLAPLANLLITPFVPVVIGGGMCIALLGGVLPVRVLSWLVGACLRAVLEISRIIGSLPGATLPVDAAWQLLWVGLAAGVVLLLLYARPGRRAAATAAAMLAVALCLGQGSYAGAHRGTVELVAIADCDAAVLLHGREAVILGTPAYYEAAALLRYLEYRGVRQIRAVVAADCGEAVGTGLAQLAARYPVDCVVGPDDSYILEAIAEALPGIPVYAGGYADLAALGVHIRLSGSGGDILLYAGNNTVLKSAAKYAIIKDNAYTIGLFPADVVVLNGAQGREPVPTGAALYGEERFRLRTLEP